MIIYNRLFLVILNFVCIGINVTAFFLVVRTVLLWKEVLWLKAFDDAGNTLVNAYTKMIGRLWSRMTQKQLTLKGKLLIGLALLEVSRILIVGFAKLL